MAIEWYICAKLNKIKVTDLKQKDLIYGLGAGIQELQSSKNGIESDLKKRPEDTEKTGLKKDKWLEISRKLEKMYNVAVEVTFILTGI